MGSRFDPYDSELRNCWCPRCKALANAHARHIPSALDDASEDLFKALKAGTHRHEGPRVSLTKWDPMKYRNDGWQLREGLGIGVTTGGVTGSVRRHASRGEK
ncbi:MAG TPA: hypothetical protein VK545_09840 [Streptomyces sp.]|nr:hypothetical protein [Streptomyces sp.]